ncbi:hypothetical protein [Falsiroseomonas stagni]|nr:hypothetical protein [Falsiroseomonas stagni]
MTLFLQHGVIHHETALLITKRHCETAIHGNMVATARRGTGHGARPPEK